MTATVRWMLGGAGALGLLFGALCFLWVVKRLGRAALGRPQAPIGGGRYVLAIVTGLVLATCGAASLGLLVALSSYRAIARKTRVAEIQCIELGPEKLRVYYVPIDRDGMRGATETYDVDGDEWTVGGDVLRFRPFLNALGVETVARVSRVEGRWLKAADADAHKGTAFDRGGGSTPTWLALYRDGARGPLGWLVAGAHGQAVSQLPDRRALFDLYVTPNGFVLDKKEL